jgi:hypothetical protein
MNLQASSRSADPLALARYPILIDDLAIRHLRTQSQIEEILHLREAIDLSVHSAGSPDFRAREKKVTSAVLSGHSICTGSTSERSESFRWIGA